MWSYGKADDETKEAENLIKQWNWIAFGDVDKKVKEANNQLEEI